MSNVLSKKQRAEGGEEREESSQTGPSPLASHPSSPDASSAAHADEAARPEAASAYAVGDRRSPTDGTAAAERHDLVSRQRAVVAMGRRAIAPPDLAILMQDAATLIAEMLGAEHSCVAELEPDRSKIALTLVMQGPGSAEPTVVVGQSGTTANDSLAAHALEVAHPVVVDQLARDTRFCDPFLQEHGIRSAVAVPLTLHGQSFGALVACTSEVRQFDTEDVLFVESVAHLITTTIARVRTEKTLAEERQLFHEVLQAADKMVLVLDVQGRVVRANRACEEVTALSADAIKGRPIWDVFDVPEEMDLFYATLGKLRQGMSPIKHESLVRCKNADRRRIAWSYAAVHRADGSIESIVASGSDAAAKRRPSQPAHSVGDRGSPTDATTAEVPASPFGGTRESPPPKNQDDFAMAEAEAEDRMVPGAGLPPGLVTSDRRRAPRRSYRYRQLIAPVVDDTLPDRHEFTEVECNDIAVGGFSFLSSKPPQSDTLVVALGAPHRLIYLTAQIVHINRVRRDGRWNYLVGCCYTGRAQY